MYAITKEEQQVNNNNSSSLCVYYVCVCACEKSEM